MLIRIYKVGLNNAYRIDRWEIHEIPLSSYIHAELLLSTLQNISMLCSHMYVLCKKELKHAYMTLKSVSQVVQTVHVH